MMSGVEKLSKKWISYGDLVENGQNRGEEI